jgi:hypothetical protein
MASSSDNVLHVTTGELVRIARVHSLHLEKYRVQSRRY